MPNSDVAVSPKFFNREIAEAYDGRNSALTPISDCLHFLMHLVLADQPVNARVLCVGVGTGAEILTLAIANPGWSFVGVDPSGEMLEVGRRRLEEAGLLQRCELLQGYAEDVTQDCFDAAVSLLVAHFVKREDRHRFYSAIHNRLRPGGRFVCAEISCDLDASTFPDMLKDWKSIQLLMGSTQESLAKLGKMIRDVLDVLSPADTEAMLKASGFWEPVPFFQAYMIRGWHAARD